MSCPPVSTNRCCKLVSDQVATRVGSASHRHNFPTLFYAQPQSRRVGPKAMAGKPSIATACLPPLIHCSAVPRFF